MENHHKLRPQTALTCYLIPMTQQWRIYMQCRSHRRRRFHPRVRKIPWRRKWQPTSLYLPGESHGQRSLVDYSPIGSQRVWQDWAAKHICSYHWWRVQEHLNWVFSQKPAFFFFFEAIFNIEGVGWATIFLKLRVKLKLTLIVARILLFVAGEQGSLFSRWLLSHSRPLWFPIRWPSLVLFH